MPPQLPAWDLAPVTFFQFLFLLSPPSSCSLLFPFNLHNRFPFSTFTCLMLHKCHLNIFLTRLCWPDFQQLHRNVGGVGWMAFQLLVPAATCAPHQRHTGGAVNVLHLCRVFLHHLHQSLNSPAEAPTPHFLEHQHFSCAVYTRQG